LRIGDDAARHQQADARQSAGLLRARPKWLCSRATKESDEIASPHGSRPGKDDMLPHFSAMLVFCVTAKFASMSQMGHERPKRAATKLNSRKAPKWKGRPSSFVC